MSLQRNKKVNISPIFYIVLAIIIINIIIAFPILILFIALWFFKWDINLDKLIKNIGLSDFLKKQFWENYEDIIAEMKKTKGYQQRVRNNKNKRDQVEDLFTDSEWKDIDENFERKSEEKFKKMQRELEDKKNQEKVFYQQNQKTLQDKLSQSSKVKALEKPKQDTSYKSLHTLNSSKKINKNFFWNSHKSNLFSENKSIWDDYESVTDKFSSNKK
jgi:hypothetical protein